MAKAYSVRGLHSHVCYSAEDLATHFGVHVQTIRDWMHKGLAPIDARKPTLFFGSDVIRHINRINDRRKIETAFGEFYCMACHRPHSPAHMQIALTQAEGRFIRATGVCAHSGKIMHKSYKMDDVPQLIKIFNVVDIQRLYDSVHPTLNTHIAPDSNQGPKQITLQGI